MVPVYSKILDLGTLDLGMLPQGLSQIDEVIF
jgi:hypothetical protein